jgi:hypothetical protein
MVYLTRRQAGPDRLFAGRSPSSSLDPRLRTDASVAWFSILIVLAVSSMYTMDVKMNLGVTLLKASESARRQLGISQSGKYKRYDEASSTAASCPPWRSCHTCKLLSSFLGTLLSACYT